MYSLLKKEIKKEVLGEKPQCLQETVEKVVYEVTKEMKMVNYSLWE